MRSDSLPDPYENNKHDYLCPLPIEIFENLNRCGEKVRDIHEAYSIPDESEDDVTTPAMSIEKHDDTQTRDKPNGYKETM